MIIKVGIHSVAKSTRTIKYYCWT